MVEVSKEVCSFAHAGYGLRHTIVGRPGLYVGHGPFRATKPSLSWFQPEAVEARIAEVLPFCDW